MMKQESGRPDGLEIISNFFETKCDLKERKRKNEKEKFPPAPPIKEKEKKEKAEKTREMAANGDSSVSSNLEKRRKNHGDRFLNETMKWISLQKPVPMIQKPVPMILLCASFAVNTAYGTGS